MLEALQRFDSILLGWCNSSLANPVFDFILPAITDIHKLWVGRIIFLSLWIFLIWRGGKRGRIVGLALVPLVLFADQLSSAGIKHLVMRSRPCWSESQALLVKPLRLLAECGGGYSFPSSHAVNHFAIATFLSFNFPQWRFWLFSYATIIAFSRVYCGVHYPSDVIVGAMIGTTCGFLFTVALTRLGKRFPQLSFDPPEVRSVSTIKNYDSR